MSRTDEQSQGAGTQDIADRWGHADQRQPFRAAVDRPKPYSREDLCQRLERLPRGHPSSPYNADGSRKPPPPRLRDLELPLPGEDSGGPDGDDEGENGELG